MFRDELQEPVAGGSLFWSADVDDDSSFGLQHTVHLLQESAHISKVFGALGLEVLDHLTHSKEVPLSTSLHGQSCTIIGDSIVSAHNSGYTD